VELPTLITGVKLAVPLLQMVSDNVIFVIAGIGFTVNSELPVIVTGPHAGVLTLVASTV
jgi:hypothetical protein